MSSSIEKAPETASAPVRMLRGERWPAVLAHLSTAVPFWALAANALIYFAFREKSRAVCFHARQGIHFQMLFLVVLVAKLLLDVAARPLGVLLAMDSLPGRVDQAGWLILLVLFALYAGCCLLGVVQACRGRFFPYPFVGKHFRRFLRPVGE